MSERLGFNPTDDPGYRAATRRADQQGIAFTVARRGDRWTVIATHHGTGLIAETSAAQLALAAWQALEQLRPAVEAERHRVQELRAVAQRPRPQRILVPRELVIEAYDLLLACDESGEPPDDQRVRAIVERLRPLIIKAAR